MNKQKTLKEGPLTEDEFSLLASLAKRVLWSEPSVRKVLQEKHKINITPANFYSNIPLIEDIESSFEYRENQEATYCSLFDANLMADFATNLVEYAKEFNPPIEGDRENPNGYFWGNPAFSFLDAMSYYCMVRYIKPKHILEIGSGFSTLVADQAMRKNGFGEITLVEPYPMDFLHKDRKSVV